MIDRNSYPDGASLDEQRRAFALSHSHGPLEAERIEQYLAGPIGNAQSSDPTTSGEADTPEAKNLYSITENPYAHQVWNRGYKEANTPLKKLSDIDRDPAVAPFVSANTYPNDLPHNPFVTGSNEAEAWIGGYTRGIRWERDRRTDHEDQASYDRGWRNGSEAAVHIAESDAQKRGWNAALDELLGKRLSLDVLNKYIDTGAPKSSSVRNILLGMKKP